MSDRGQLSNALDDMARMLASTSSGLYQSGPFGNCIHHLNTRLFLQVHVTNVIEASQEYDQAVTAYMAVRAEQQQNERTT